MLFNSIEFCLFLLVVVPGFFWLPHRPRLAFLLVASYVFYAWWNARYAVLIALSTVMDFFLARAMAKSPTQEGRKRLLLVSLVVNLGVLFVFKYWNFANDSMKVLCAQLGVAWEVPALYVLLPPGISFYTFQTLSYTIDVYRKEDESEKSLERFALFIAFFPQLVAGPIERASHLKPQFDEIKHFDWARFASGLQLVLWGLFQKVVIADRLATYVDAVYNNVGNHNATSYWLATYAFAFQIYCDFAGYSEIAVGTARMLGYNLMDNFKRPYFSDSITTFWRRWHISLSTWLRDYLYISLGGNRHGQWMTYRNLMITMLLGGLWHGASWNFVIWGGLQGIFLSFSRLTLPLRDRLNAKLGLPKPLVLAGRMFITFHLVCLSWIFFRANSFQDALTIVGGFFTRPWGMPFVELIALLYGFGGVGLLLALHTYEAQREPWLQTVARWPRPLRWAVWYLLLLGIVLFGVEQGSQFIYFQF